MAVPRGTRFEVEHDHVFPEKVTVSDPSVDKDRDKSIIVIMLGTVQPVPPETAIGGLGWVFRATGMRAPSGAVKGHSKPPLSFPAADKFAA